jgi:hypothetical protein
MQITWTAWNNGHHRQTGAGYGIKIPIADRDKYFVRDWKTIILELPSDVSFERVAVNTSKASFWTENCHELISNRIGKWLILTGYAPWPDRNPPKVKIEVLGNACFRVLGASKNWHYNNDRTTMIECRAGPGVRSCLLPPA